MTPQGEVTPVTFAELPRPAVVNVWATWCGPCRAELPVLARALQAGEPVILVNGGEDPKQVQAFLRSVGVSQETFLDSGPLRQAWRVSGYPSTFVVGREGQVVARHLGPLTAPQLRGLLQRAQQPSP
ncbi:TlpA family protein disulfide reductase [Deinococcus murrayi]|uniref:TlpA family protein disulfide reductase n=1 Tax=Deinococcus murrayi TaxID=68910 RepID=UPI0006882E4F|nr:TlpA disulfide reductase family protein [Deinococcus murrayi]